MESSTPATTRHGAWVELDELVAAHRSANALDIQHNAPAGAGIAGQIRTRQRGRGLEFEEVRQYQPGDELRALDWRVTARTGIAHTKLFREEREKPSVIVVDQRQSMAFGSRTCFKSVQAARIAALVSWAALNSNDRVGGFVFSDHAQFDLRPAKKRSTVMSLLQQITLFNQALVNQKPSKHNTEQINPIATELARIARPGSRVFIISDFIGLTEQGFEQLSRLKRHCDVYCIQIHDPMEKNLPHIGFQQFTDGVQNSSYDTNSKELQRRFAQNFKQRCNWLKTNCLGNHIAYLNVATDTDPLQALGQQFTTKRSNRISQQVRPS